MVPFLSKYLPITTFVFRVLRKTDTHGARHLERNDRNSLEYFFWVVTIMTMFFLMLFLASIFWLRHFNNPTIISIDRNYSKWNTTFPSLTLCFHDKVNETALDEFIRELNPENATELEVFLRDLINFEHNGLWNLASHPDIKESDYPQILDKLSKQFPYNATFSTGLNLPFTRILTELGVCHTFNSMIAYYISPQYINSKGHIPLPEPMKLININFYDEAKIVSIRNMTDIVDIYMHGPNEIPFPLSRRQLERLKPAYTSLRLEPFIIQSDSDVRGLMFKQRHCRFTDESNLEHFPHYYSYSLCKANCRINNFIKACGCVPFYYKAPGNSRYCTTIELDCIVFNKGQINQDECGCFKNCNEIKFILQFFKSITWFQNSTVTWELIHKKIRYKREILHRFSDVLISSGANASFFLGVTVLSALEFFYFSVIEFYHILKKYKLIKYLLNKCTT